MQISHYDASFKWKRCTVRKYCNRKITFLFIFSCNRFQFPSSPSAAKWPSAGGENATLKCIAVGVSFFECWLLQQVLNNKKAYVLLHDVGSFCRLGNENKNLEFLKRQQLLLAWIRYTELLKRTVYSLSQNLNNISKLFRVFLFKHM